MGLLTVGQKRLKQATVSNNTYTYIICKHTCKGILYTHTLIYTSLCLFYININTLIFLASTHYTHSHCHMYTHANTLLPSLYMRTHPAQAVSKQWKDNNSLLAHYHTNTPLGRSDVITREEVML